MVTAALLAPAVLRGPKDVARALAAMDDSVAALPERRWLVEAAQLLASVRSPKAPPPSVREADLDRVFRHLDLE